MPIAGLYKAFDHWHNEGTLWIISDTHFGDADIRHGFPDRPADDELVKRINSYVGRKDTLIMLGDVGDVSYVKQLRAKYKILIMGNHDCGRTNYEHQIITRRFPQEIFQKDEALAEMTRIYPGCRYTISEGCQFHYPFEYWEVTADNMLFDEVYEGALMIGEKFILSHEPVELPWALNFHGHDHQGGFHKNSVNCCCDVIGYKPINMNQIMKQGLAARIDTIHRETIDKATKRKKKRGGKKIRE